MGEVLGVRNRACAEQPESSLKPLGIDVCLMAAEKNRAIVGYEVL